MVPPQSEEKMFVKDLEFQVQYAIEVGVAQGYILPYEAVITLTPTNPGEGFSNAMRLIHIKSTPESVLF